MKTKLMIITCFSAILTACASPEERAQSEIDTNSAVINDTTSTDTVTTTGSMSGSNGTGTDTTDMKRQKATRQTAE